MPRIFDNIYQDFLPTLCSALDVAYRADFCVGYFNLRGWSKVEHYVEQFTGGEGACCRLLIGMSKLPQEELYESRSLLSRRNGIDNSQVIQMRKRIAQEFRQQLALGVPNNDEEASLRRLSAQIKRQKVVVKLFLKSSLHAKLYLVHRRDVHNPTIGLLGSSNLTLSGLTYQGELNVDVLDHDACQKLQAWFDDRWDDRWCVDISQELAKLIDQSWAREEQPPPYPAFLNSEGGALLIGVEDDGNVLGLQPDYQTLKKKNRDGYELWLMGDLLLKSLGNDVAAQLSISFGIVDNKEVCKVAVQPSPRPVYCEIKNKSGQSEECFFIRAGN